MASTYQDPDLLPDGTYRRPQDEYGQDLGAPPSAGWNQETGTWQPDSAAPPSGDAPRPAGTNTLTPPDPLAGYSATEQDWLRRNQNPNGSYDTHRMASALASPRTGGAPAQTQVTQAYAGYLNQPAPQADTSGLTATLQQMQSQQQADRARQEQQRAQMREILLGRLSKAQEPVSVDSPGIRDVIAARRLESQRGSERERAAMAERMAAQGLGDSGAFDSGVQGIEQARSEADTSAVGNILGSELDSKREEVQYLLQLAVQMGDTDTARALQEQLAGLDAQLQTARLQEGSRQFNADLGQRTAEFGENSQFRRSSFLDNLGLQLLQMQMGANRDAGSAFL